MIVKKFGIDFHSEAGALTLDSNEVCDDDSETGYHTKLHEDGWTISGQLHEDYFVWVNTFEAHHPTYGCVWGDFEDEVYADTEEGFAHFYANHAPHAWDYGDI